MFQIISSVSYLLSSIMNCVSHLVKESIPNYLHNLPVPDSVLGWFSLSLSDWAKLVPFGVAVGGLSYLSLQARIKNLHRSYSHDSVFQGLANSPVVGPAIKEKLSMLPGFKPNRVNETIKMECAKVVDSVDIEDMGDKGVFCR